MKIIDLTNDYYLVKFNVFLNYEFTLTGGPWLLYEHYLTVRPWDLNFDQEKYKIENIAIWI